MLVLGIESTCDETGCAVVRNGSEILSNVVASQADLHARFGGVIPELACRRHIDLFPSIYKQALRQAGITLKDIDVIAVARGPGLIGALLVGLNFAKGLSLSSGIPFVGVNHIEAHLYAAMLARDVPLPALGVILSGGHSTLILIEALGKYKLIGQSQDDALGEVFDKVATMLCLPYPGGPEIEKLAQGGDKMKYKFKVGQIKDSPYDFSFSGLKTAVLYLTRGQNGNKSNPLAIDELEKKDVAASFQHSAFADVVHKTFHSAATHKCKSIVVGGGVSNNLYLRELFAQKNTTSLPIFWPAAGLSLDNAAMIGALGYHVFKNKGSSDCLSLEPLTRMPFS